MRSPCLREAVANRSTHLARRTALAAALAVTIIRLPRAIFFLRASNRRILGVRLPLPMETPDGASALAAPTLN